MPERPLTTPASTDQFMLTDHPAPTLTDRCRPLPDGMDHTHLTVVPAHQAGSRYEQEEPPRSTTPKDVIRAATRAFRNSGVRGVRTYLHINCGCRIASSLMGTYDTIDDARRKGTELLEGTGDYYRTCSKSGLVKAQALGRSVRYFDDTMQAAASTFNGAGVRDGDVVVASEGVVAIAIRAAVIAITANRGHLAGLDACARTFRDGLYAEIVDRAEAEARKIRATIDPLHAAPAAEEAPAAPATPADAVRTDGVQVKADGRGKWVVVRGGDYLGVTFDEGPEMKRGRFTGWSPYAGTPGNTTAFSNDPAKVVESIVQAWPVTAAEVVAQTGASLDAVLATAEQVTEQWQATGRRAVLRIAAAKGAATKMTREAAAEATARLTAPVPPLVLDLPTGHCVHGEHGAGKDEAQEAPAELPDLQWGTLKGLTAPFRLWGEECEGGRFRPAFDRKQVTGEPLVIVEVWTTQRGTARHGRDANGREIHLYGAATRFWRAPRA